MLIQSDASQEFREGPQRSSILGSDYPCIGVSWTRVKILDSVKTGHTLTERAEDEKCLGAGWIHARSSHAIYWLLFEDSLKEIWLKESTESPGMVCVIQSVCGETGCSSN